MAQWTIYYNPKCGTCRNTLALLRDRGVEPKIVEYLKTPPTVAELKAIVDALGEPAETLLRTKEEAFVTRKLAGVTDQQRILEAIAAEPVLLQRPVVTNGKKAVIARPPEKVEALF